MTENALCPYRLEVFHEISRLLELLIALPRQAVPIQSVDGERVRPALFVHQSSDHLDDDELGATHKTTDAPLDFVRVAVSAQHAPHLGRLVLPLFR